MTPKQPKPLAEATKDITDQELLLQARELQERINSVKPLYTELEAIVLELVERRFSTTLLPDGTQCLLTDNFIDAKTGQPRNVVFRPAGVKRFELEFTDEASAARARARADKKAAKGSE